MLGIVLADFCYSLFSSSTFSSIFSCLCATVTEGITAMSVMEEEPVTLNTDAELQTDDEILWMFGDKDAEIAQTKGGTRQTITSNGPDERFRDRLKLDHLTGSLTITNTTAEDTGQYKLKIIRSGNVSLKLFCVSVFGE